MGLFDFWHTYQEKLFYPLSFVCVAVISYCLGRLSLIEEKREPVLIIPPSATSTISQSPLGGGAALLVGSKKGSKYHFPWCSGAERISDENKIYFKTKEEAQARGYTPASNCPGLE
jgi:hypothetical protein